MPVAYPRGHHLIRCFNWVGSSLTHKHLTRLEKLARDKHSSLLLKFVNYRRKKFYIIDTRSDIEKTVSLIIFSAVVESGNDHLFSMSNNLFYFVNKKTCYCRFELGLNVIKLFMTIIYKYWYFAGLSSQV
jgi:hypothetical protein